MAEQLPAPAEKAAWPTQCAGPKELHEWLNKLTSQHGVPVRIVLGMRWLVLSELDRTAPEPEAKDSPAFSPSDVNGFDARPLGNTYRSR